MDVYLIKERCKKTVKQVQGINWGQLFLVVVLAFAAIWVWSNYSEPGSVSLTVTALDAGPVPGAQVDVFDDQDRLIAREVFLDGTGVIRGLPSGKNLFLEIDAGDSLKQKRVSFQLKSAETLRLSFDLESSSLLFFGDDYALPSQIGKGCFTEFVIAVENNGERDALAQVVGEGGLSGSVSSEPVNVPALSKASVKIRVSAGSEFKESVLSGSLRLKRLSESLPLSLTVSDPPRISVSPSSLSPSVDAGGLFKAKLDVLNQGRQPLAHDELSVSFNGEIKDWASFDYMDPVFDSIQRNEKQSLILYLNVPNATVAGKYFGEAVFKTNCGSDSSSITVTVK
jgi:hypothetical protein